MNQQSHKFDVAVIIVTYNSADEIERCLRSVIDERSHLSQEIIVVDNLSQDSTVSIIKNQFPQVTLIEPGQNLGFAAGVNLGVSASNAEFVLLFNPDAVIRDHAVDVITAFAKENPRYGLYGGRAVDEDGHMDPSSCWGAPSLWSLFLFATGLTTLLPRHAFFNPESLADWNRDSVKEVGIITGCFLLSKRQVWDELGGLDERYFMYGEDADLAIRARKIGYSPVICPDAVFVHEGGKSSETPVEKTLLLFRGKASLVRIQWDGITRRLGLLFLAAGTGLRAIIANISHCSRRSHSKRWPTVWKQRQEWLQGY